MTRKVDISPPKWADRFLRFYCRDEFIEEIEGDIHEIFEVNLRENGVGYAKRKFVWDVFRFFRWSNIKQTRRLNSNNTAMFKNYFKITRRNLVNDRGYSLLNISGLYIGFICLILTVLYLNHHFSFDKHHPRAKDLYRIVEVNPSTGAKGNQSAAPWAPALDEQFPEIQDYTRTITHGTAVFEVDNKRFYENGGIIADASILRVFSIDLKDGDVETALKEPNQVIVKKSLAEKYFGKSDPIGQIIRVDSQNLYKVTGVLADEQSPSVLDFDFIVSFESHDSWFKSDWLIRNYETFFLLNSGINQENLESKITGYFNERFQGTETPFDQSFELQPFTDLHLYDDTAGQIPVIRRVIVVGVIGLFILIIALVNYVNLITARSINRLKEVGVRKSIGANKKQLIYQFLTENLLVCLATFLISIFSVNLFLSSFNNLMNTDISLNIESNILLVAVILLITIVIGIISGFYPAFVLSSLKVVNLVKGTPNLLGSKNYLRKSLMTIQFVISLALIIGTGMVQKQLQYMLDKDLGFDQEQVVVVPLGNGDVWRNKQVFADQITALSGVKNVALTANEMGGGDWGIPFKYEGEQEPLNVRFMAVDAAYGETIGLELLEGRFFDEELKTDVESGFIVNEAFLKTVGWESGLGKRVDMPTRNSAQEWTWTVGKIVGVVKDFNFRSLHSQVSPMVIGNKVNWTSTLFIKLTPGSTDEVLNDIAEIWKSTEPNTPFGYYFMDDRIEQQYEAEANLSKVATVFGAIAIFLAALGLFSLATYMAEQKMKEVSIRKVLGASLREVWYLFSKQFIAIILIAALLAIPLSLYYLNNWLSTFAFRIEVWQSMEIPVLALCGTVLIALLTVSVQSGRLSRANPVKYLRGE